MAKSSLVEAASCHARKKKHATALSAIRTVATHACKIILDSVPILVHTWIVKNNEFLKVKFYKTDSGNEPVREWLLEKVTAEERKTIGTDIKDVQFSWPIGMPLVESFGDHLWQVRSKLQDRIARVFFTTHNSEIILLHGFIKKTNKTPKADLALAIKRKADFKEG